MVKRRARRPRGRSCAIHGGIGREAVQPRVLCCGDHGRFAAAIAREVGGADVREKVIGVLGGMGPEATLALLAKIVKQTGARTDQEHLRILVDNNPKIPNRTLAIQGKGPSPVRAMRSSARALERGGADFIVIPCVTAHYFFASLRRTTHVPLVHLVDETVAHVHERFPALRAVGLLATTGTLEAGLFQDAFAGTTVSVLTPSAGVQKQGVMRALFAKRGIKAMGPSPWSKKLIVDAASTLVARGAQVIIAGCTEIPLVLQDGDLSVPVVDPLSVLARVAIERARGRAVP
jgi:aspartate racemase